ncbi:hypothetical protein M3Y98_00828300 [Aphelenchoides besseyi]|nr:hypothetical protein M3Y98_00828300 [Aphelenchoides besseyi]
MTMKYRNLLLKHVIGLRSSDAVDSQSISLLAAESENGSPQNPFALRWDMTSSSSSVEYSGLIVRLTPEYGLLLCDQNVTDNRHYVVFDPWTYVGVHRIQDICALNEMFAIGTEVKFKIHGEFSVTTLQNNGYRMTKVHSLEIVNESSGLQLAQLITLKKNLFNCELALAFDTNKSLVLVHSHGTHFVKIDSCFTEPNASEALAAAGKEEMNELDKVIIFGRSFEARLLKLPMWLSATFTGNHRPSYITIDIQNYSTEVYGYARVSQITNGHAILTALEDPSVTIIFPRVLIPNELKNQFESLAIDAVFYFVACRDFPNSPYTYRAFNLRVPTEDDHNEAREMHTTECSHHHEHRNTTETDAPTSGIGRDFVIPFDNEFNQVVVNETTTIETTVVETTRVETLVVDSTAFETKVDEMVSFFENLQPITPVVTASEVSLVTAIEEPQEEEDENGMIPMQCGNY